MLLTITRVILIKMILPYQTSTLSTQAGILQPGPHVLVGIDDQRSHHKDPLPVLHYSLAALHKTYRILSFTGNMLVKYRQHIVFCVYVGPVLCSY